MNDQIKILSLAVIAVCLVVHTILDIANLGSTPAQSAKATTTQTQNNNSPQAQNQPPSNQTEAPEVKINKQQAENKNQQQSNQATTTVKFDKTSHDFGTIPQKTKVEEIFTFTNTGDEPLVINNAKGSCGCTVPEYPEPPIRPGEQSGITVAYSSSNRKGKQRNSVTINANTDQSPLKLTISANVDPNASKQGGKQPS
jgi:hypothetical protein